MSKVETARPTLHEDWIDPTARRIVQILQNAGFETYLVGGCVRDLLAGIHPKDFDIATSALPQEVKRKVPGAYIIGKRFRLVLVKRGDQQFEVATFRRNIRPEEIEQQQSDDPGPAVSVDNYFGTNEEDAQRRDFTVNALFYDPIKHKILDFVNGQQDVDQRVIRMIGNPKERFIEDPIRILRALRLSHKLCFTLEPELRAAMMETYGELLRAALPRRREEWLKILRLDEPGRAFAELMDLGILEKVLPGLHELYQEPDKALLFEHYLAQIPRVGIDMASPAELLSGMMYAFLRAKQGEDDADPTPAEIEDNPRWVAFMKDEIGMFRMETTVFLKCLELIPSFENIQSFEKKGSRRQMGFLRNESLVLALRLSQIDGTLDDRSFRYWVSQLRRLNSKAEADQNEASAEA